MINVLHIDTEMTWRGGENQILQLVQGSLDQCGHHIAVRPDSLAAERFKNICPTILVNMRGGFSPIAAWKLARYCRQNAISVLDAHSSNAHAIGLLIKIFAPELKLVVHRRVDFIPKSDFINRRKYESKSVDHYVAISFAIKKILEDYGIPSNRIEVVRSAVDLTKYQDYDRKKEKAKLAETFSLSPDLVFIGNASAFSHQKGYPTLIKACKILKDRGTGFHAFLAGDGDLMNSMEKLRAELGLEHDVTFLGFIKEVPRFLSALDILAVSSRTEGLGTIILDGIGAGLAVAATRTGGIPEMIVHEETGLLSPVDDAEALASNLTKLVKSADLRLQYNKKARTLVDRDFSVSNMVRGNLKTYRSLMREPS